jgi:transposase-like protein
MGSTINRRDLEKESFWRDKIKAHRLSGLSRSAFCRQHQLNVNALSKWTQIIKKRDLEPKSLGRKITRARSYSGAERRRLVERWRSSGLTQVEFCRREGIFDWQLSDWKGRIAREERPKKEQEIDVEPKTRFAEVEFAKICENGTADKMTVINSCPQPSASYRVAAEVRCHQSVIAIFDGADSQTVRDIISALTEHERDRT